MQALLPGSSQPRVLHPRRVIALSHLPSAAPWPQHPCFSALHPDFLASALKRKKEKKKKKAYQPNSTRLLTIPLPLHRVYTLHVRSLHVLGTSPPGWGSPAQQQQWGSCTSGTGTAVSPCSVPACPPPHTLAAQQGDQGRRRSSPPSCTDPRSQTESGHGISPKSERQQSA